MKDSQQPTYIYRPLNQNLNENVRMNCSKHKSMHRLIKKIEFTEESI